RTEAARLLPERAHGGPRHTEAEAAPQQELTQPRAECLVIQPRKGAEPLPSGLQRALLVTLRLADHLHHLAGDATLAQLLAKGAGRARTEALAVLHPELREIAVVEQLQFLQPIEDTLHRLRAGDWLVAVGGEQPAAHFGPAAWPRREEAHRSVEEHAL